MDTALNNFWSQIPESLYPKMEIAVETDLHGFSRTIIFRSVEKTTVVMSHKFPAHLPQDQLVLPDEFVAKLCVVM